MTPEPEEAALAAALPRLRWIQIGGWVVLLAILVAAAFLANAIGFEGKTNAKLNGGVLGLAIVTPFLVYRFVQRRHDSEVLPLITSAFDMSYDKPARSFVGKLPAVTPPRSRVLKAEDALSGTLAGRHWDFAEVKTETGGKHSHVVFKGVVVIVECETPLPDMIYTAYDTTQTQGLFGLGKPAVDVSALYSMPQQKPSWPGTYGVWRRGREVPEGLGPFIDTLNRAANGFGADSTLQQVVSDGRIVALAISSVRDFFRVGGLFATRESVLQDVRHVADEIARVTRLVEAVLRAEAALRAAQNLPPGSGGS